MRNTKYLHEELDKKSPCPCPCHKAEGNDPSKCSGMCDEFYEHLGWQVTEAPQGPQPRKGDCVDCYIDEPCSKHDVSTDPPEAPQGPGREDEIASSGKIICGDCGRHMSLITVPRRGWKCLFCASETKSASHPAEGKARPSCPKCGSNVRLYAACEECHTTTELFFRPILPDAETLARKMWEKDSSPKHRATSWDDLRNTERGQTYLLWAESALASLCSLVENGKEDR